VGSDDMFHEILGALTTQETKYVGEVVSIHVGFEVGPGINSSRTELALPEVSLRIIDAVI
jgi:hypothetical protein